MNYRSQSQPLTNEAISRDSLVKTYFAFHIYMLQNPMILVLGTLTILRQTDTVAV